MRGPSPDGAVVKIGPFTVTLEHPDLGRRTVTVQRGDPLPHEVFVQFYLEPSYDLMNRGWRIVDATEG